MDSLTCPSCQSAMNKVKQPDITTDRCPNCGGIFLDKGELDVVATGIAGEIEFCSVDEREQIDKHPYRKCPKPACAGNKMRKIGLLIYCDTIFDYCEKCGGFFLDKEEIQEMNLELEQISKDKIAEEFRDYIDGRLVRLDKIGGVTLAGSAGFITGAKGVDKLRISVFFKKPFNLGLRLYSEKWTDKFVKLIGLFNREDIQIGSERLDSLFIIQGADKAKIQSLLSNPDIQEQLCEFQAKKYKMYATPGTLEIVDRRIIYTEGPYTGGVKYDVNKDRIGVVGAMLKLAARFEEVQES